jgi:hypothetical protein
VRKPERQSLPERRLRECFRRSGQIGPCDPRTVSFVGEDPGARPHARTGRVVSGFSLFFGRWGRRLESTPLSLAPPSYAPLGSAYHEICLRHMVEPHTDEVQDPGPQGWCVCGQKVTIANPREVTLPNGRGPLPSMRLSAVAIRRKTADS